MSKTQLQIFLKNVIQSRLEKEFKGNEKKISEINTDNLDRSELSKFTIENKLSYFEIITLLLALIPHISPEFLSSIISEYLPNGGDFPEIGGTKGKTHRGILPTGETALYILAGKDVEKRIEVSKLFDESHLFSKKVSFTLNLSK